MAGLIDIGSAIAGPAVKVVGDVLNRLLPPEKASEIDTKRLEAEVLLELKSQDFKALEGQLAINLADAQSGRWWQSGWRPFIGWVCGASLAYSFVLQPFLAFWIGLYKWQLPPLPMLDSGDLTTILLGMLGLGGLRTWEKVSMKRS